MLGHFSELTINLLGYPIALAIMTVFYASELSSGKFRAATRWLVPARIKMRRR